jgi:hypothetical protein
MTGRVVASDVMSPAGIHMQITSVELNVKVLWALFFGLPNDTTPVYCNALRPVSTSIQYSYI